jgi:8-oxo-dGTP diphosphatase
LGRGVLLKFCVFFILAGTFFASSPAFPISICLENLRKIAEAKRDHLGQTSRIGVAVIITRGDKILLGKRKLSKTWGFAGGTVELTDKSIEAAASRETLEETGLKLKNMKVVHLQQEFVEERQRNYFIAIVIADAEEGDAKVMEPTKADAWEWFPWNDFPKPLFPPNKRLLESRLKFLQTNFR